MSVIRCWTGCGVRDGQRTEGGGGQEGAWAVTPGHGVRNWGGGGGREMVGQKSKCCILVSLSVRGALSSKSDQKKKKKKVQKPQAVNHAYTATTELQIQVTLIFPTYVKMQQYKNGSFISR